MFYNSGIWPELLVYEKFENVQSPSGICFYTIYMFIVCQNLVKVDAQVFEIHHFLNGLSVDIYRWADVGALFDSVEV